MSTRRASLAKSILAGLLWVLLRLPMDIVLAHCRESQIVPYAITIQVMDFILVSYLLFKHMQYRARTPWKCPVCDGWGRRMFVPGQSDAARSQLATCAACGGSGYIWEDVGHD